MTAMNNKSQDQILMRNGEVMVLRNGEMRPMDEELLLPDGTQVAIDGTVMMLDGTTRMMAEGERMTIEAAPTSPENMTDRQFKETMEDEELRDDIK